mmetsp:Transcript_32966/g.72415  ORF Transcript_32966/g.72415 Transcript_32966/m.72415 type:complete len:203 (-) Transcript_32966:1417-2025(-)
MGKTLVLRGHALLRHVGRAGQPSRPHGHARPRSARQVGPQLCSGSNRDALLAQGAGRSPDRRDQARRHGRVGAAWRHGRPRRVSLSGGAARVYRGGWQHPVGGGPRHLQEARREPLQERRGGVHGLRRRPAQHGLRLDGDHRLPLSLQRGARRAAAAARGRRRQGRDVDQRGVGGARGALRLAQGLGRRHHLQDGNLCQAGL